MASRADPAVPLARVRARGELVEIRAAELRFTPVLQRQPADVRDFLLHTSVTSGAFPRNHQSDIVLISHSWRSGGTTHERHRSH